jgi:protein-S-isoprenylcysteine O-methyltransferase Ste14
MTTSPKDRGPAVPFPPPLLFVAGYVGGWLIERFVWSVPFVPGDGSNPILEVGGAALTMLALTLIAWGMGTFYRARTAIIPNRPATRIVRHGPYRFTRNPMYVGMTVLHAGLTLLANTVWPLLFLPVVLVVLERQVIRREER